MKKLHLTLLFVSLVVGGLVFHSCRQEIFGPPEPRADESPDFTLEEARMHFYTVLTRMTTEPEEGIVPAVFAPQWDEARFHHLDNREKITVPINTGASRRVFVPRSEGGKSYRVEARQSLMFIKNVEHDTVFTAIETVVPDKEFYARNKNQARINIARPDFSGVVFWHTLEGRLAHIEEIENGRTVRAASFMDRPFEEYENLLNRVLSAIGTHMFAIRSGQRPRTKNDPHYESTDRPHIVEIKFEYTDSHPEYYECGHCKIRYYTHKECYDHVVNTHMVDKKELTDPEGETVPGDIFGELPPLDPIPDGDNSGWEDNSDDGYSGGGGDSWNDLFGPPYDYDNDYDNTDDNYDGGGQGTGGGSGGGGGGNTGGGIVDRNQQMFSQRFSTTGCTPAETQAIRDLAVDLYGYGLGRAAIDMLDKVDIRFRNDNEPKCEYVIGRNSILLRKDATTLELFHEIVHALQDQRWSRNHPGVNIDDALISMEIEAWIASGLFASKYQVSFQNGSYELQKHVLRMSLYINERGIFDYSKKRSVMEGKATSIQIFEKDVDKLVYYLRNIKDYENLADSYRPEKDSLLKIFQEIVVNSNK